MMSPYLRALQILGEMKMLTPVAKTLLVFTVVLLVLVFVLALTTMIQASTSLSDEESADPAKVAEHADLVKNLAVGTFVATCLHVLVCVLYRYNVSVVPVKSLL